MSEEILGRVLSEVQENRAETRRLGDEVLRLSGETRRLGEKVDRLAAIVDRVETKTDRLTADMEDVKVRLYAVETGVVGNMSTVVSQSHRLDSLDLRVKLIEKRPELRDSP